MMEADSVSRQMGDPAATPDGHIAAQSTQQSEAPAEHQATPSDPAPTESNQYVAASNGNHHASPSTTQTSSPGSSSTQLPKHHNHQQQPPHDPFTQPYPTPRRPLHSAWSASQPGSPAPPSSQPLTPLTPLPGTQSGDLQQEALLAFTREQLQLARSQLVQEKRHSAHITAELQQALTTETSLRSELEQLQHTSATLKQQLASSRATITDLEEQLLQSNQDNELLASQLGTYMQQEQNAHPHHQQQQPQQQQHQSPGKMHEDDGRSLARMQKAERALEKERLLVVALQQQVAQQQEAAQKGAAALEQFQELRQELLDCQHQLEQREQAVAELSGTVESSQQAVAALRAQLSALMSAGHHHVAGEQQLSHELARLKQENEQMRAREDSKELALRAAQARVESVEATALDEKRQCDALAVTIHKLLVEAQELTERVNVQSLQIAYYEDELRCKAADMEVLERMLRQQGLHVGQGQAQQQVQQQGQQEAARQPSAWVEQVRMPDEAPPSADPQAGRPHEQQQAAQQQHLLSSGIQEAQEHVHDASGAPQEPSAGAQQRQQQQQQQQEEAAAQVTASPETAPAAPAAPVEPTAEAALDVAEHAATVAGIRHRLLLNQWAAEPGPAREQELQLLALAEELQQLEEQQREERASRAEAVQQLQRHLGDAAAAVLSKVYAEVGLPEDSTAQALASSGAAVQMLGLSPQKQQQRHGGFGAPASSLGAREEILLLSREVKRLYGLVAQEQVLTEALQAQLPGAGHAASGLPQHMASSSGSRTDDAERGLDQSPLQGMQLGSNRSSLSGVRPHTATGRELSGTNSPAVAQQQLQRPKAAAVEQELRPASAPPAGRRRRVGLWGWLTGADLEA